MQVSHPNASDRLVNKRQVAERLSMSVRSVDRLIAAGILERVKVLGAVRFRLSQVQHIIEGKAS